MSVTLNIKAFAGKNSPEFQKHLKAVQFCIENGLSFPAETSQFFKGKVGGDNLEDISTHVIMQYIENGVEVSLPIQYVNEYTIKIPVASIPKEVDEIIVTLS